MGIFSLNKHVALAVKAVCWLARLVRWRSFLRAKRRGRLSAICAGIGRRDRPVLKPARQRRCSAWMSRSAAVSATAAACLKRFPAFLNAGTVRFVYARCGVNALSGLQILPNSIYCRNHVGLISVAHQAIFSDFQPRLFLSLSARIFTPASIFSGSGT
ncbi:4'-phosphopantetheinyl transferase [Escherichia coli]|uniref:4'-phosphopantetheinyl transferase n=1 Tax=Escherichia coli TaxID=562 RepID=A0A2X1NB16_ECOLX|nr:4'-phosphopantetheinyl transferase [Escherichia coli]